MVFGLLLRPVSMLATKRYARRKGLVDVSRRIRGLPSSSLSRGEDALLQAAWQASHRAPSIVISPSSNFVHQLMIDF